MLEIDPHPPAQMHKTCLGLFSIKVTEHLPLLKLSPLPLSDIFFSLSKLSMASFIPISLSSTSVQPYSKKENCLSKLEIKCSFNLSKVASYALCFQNT